MSSAKQITFIETIPELRKLKKASIPMIALRIRALIEIKKHQKEGISKRALGKPFV